MLMCVYLCLRCQESQELDQQLCACQQKLQTLLKELEETQHHCEALTRELDATKLHTKEKVKSKHNFLLKKKKIQFKT